MLACLLAAFAFVVSEKKMFGFDCCEMPGVYGLEFCCVWFYGYGSCRPLLLGYC